MRLFKSLCFSLIFLGILSLQAQQKTYCNPINIDYGYTPFDVFSKQGKHRATADPVIVNFKNKYFLFSTNQEGYWWSDDMLNWKFVFLGLFSFTHMVGCKFLWMEEEPKLF